MQILLWAMLWNKLIETSEWGKFVVFDAAGLDGSLLFVVLFGQDLSTEIGPLPALLTNQRPKVLSLRLFLCHLSMVFGKHLNRPLSAVVDDAKTLLIFNELLVFFAFSPFSWIPFYFVMMETEIDPWTCGQICDIGLLSDLDFRSWGANFKSWLFVFVKRRRKLQVVPSQRTLLLQWQCIRDKRQETEFRRQEVKVIKGNLQTFIRQLNINFFVWVKGSDQLEVHRLCCSGIVQGEPVDAE